MSRAFKILVNLIVIIFIVAAAALIIPPLVGVSTSVVDSEIDSNMDVGSVAYGVRRPIASLEEGTDQIVYSGETFTYLYYVDKVDTANGEVYATDTSTGQQSVLQIPKNATKLVLVVPYIGYGLMAVYSDNGIYALLSLAGVLVMLLIVANIWFRRKHPSDEGYTDEDDDDYFAALAQSIERKPSGLDNIKRSPSASATGTIPVQSTEAAAASDELIITNAEPAQAAENTAPLPDVSANAAPVNNGETFIIPDADVQGASGTADAGISAAAAAAGAAVARAAAGVASADNNAEAVPAAEAVSEVSEKASEAEVNTAEAAENITQAVQQAATEDTAPAAAAQAAPAGSSWTCECGTANNGNFCTNCGKPRAASQAVQAAAAETTQQDAPKAAAETAQQEAPKAAAPEAAANTIDDDGVPAYVPPANSPYNTGNIAAAFAEIPEENSAASLDLDENVIPDVSEALVAALATTNVSRSERAYTQNIQQPEEVQEEEQLYEIELAIPVRTADEILEEAYTNGLDPKVSSDEVTGIKFIDFSDSL